MSENKEQEFINQFRFIAEDAYNNSASKGFWDTIPNRAEKLCLMHSELSECLEGLRHDNPPSDHIPEFTAEEEELADTIIRIMDYSIGFNCRTAEAVIAKMQYNASRPYMHGKKL